MLVNQVLFESYVTTGDIRLVLLAWEGVEATNHKHLLSSLRIHYSDLSRNRGRESYSDRIDCLDSA